MAEKEKATGGQPMAGGQSNFGQEAQPQYSTENSEPLSDFQDNLGDQGASIPFMITRQQRMRLAGLGYTESQVNAMTPSAAHELLAEYDHPMPSSNGAHPVDSNDLLDEIEALVEQAMVAKSEQVLAKLSAEDTAFLLSAGLHDEGNAQCINRLYPGQSLWNESFGWLHYTGTHWESDGAECVKDFETN